jgi:CubicO group peptidase (beta-lactamase class C family)
MFPDRQHRLVIRLASALSGSRPNREKPMDAVLGEGSAQEAGLTAAGLKRVDEAMAELIAAGELAGAVMLAARHGKVAHRSVQGLKDIASGEPLAHDTIFRIYSMTKPVTAVAMMILHDQGLWSPDDPIARRLPEFADVKGPGGGAPAHPPTLRELMTHTAGLGYGFEADDPTDAAYIAAGVWQAADLDEMVRRIVSAPLAYEPGSAWRYSIAMDVQGAIVEKLSGQSLPDFMRERIFRPLGMADTDFYVPAEKAPRLATLYRHSRARGLVVVDQPLFGRDAGRIPKIASGGGGLFSTADDYARFAQMLLNGGELGGVRIVSREAVALMTANHLSDEIMAGGYGVGHQPIRPGFGYGFNGAVFTDPALAGSKVGRGTYQWDGAAGTWFWIDPENEVVFVGLIQRMDERSPGCQALTQALVAEALG